MARIVPAEKAAPAQPKTTNVRTAAAALPASLAELAKTKLIDVHTVILGDTLFAVWKAKAASMSWPEFEKLNAHVTTAERRGGNLLVAGDQLAIPSQATSRASAMRAADGFATGPTPNSVAPADNPQAFLELVKNAPAAGTGAKAPFTFLHLGEQLVADADKNIARLAREQDELGASTTGVTREVLGIAAAAGAFMGKTVHTVERLVGLAIEGIAITGDKPEQTLHRSIAAVKEVSVGGTIGAVVRAAQGLFAAGIEASDKRGVGSPIFETALNLLVSKGGGVLSKEKIVSELANAAEKVSGGDAVVVQVAEAAKKAVGHQSILERIGAIASSIEPVAAAAVGPAVNVTRATAAATVLNKSPASSTDSEPK